MTQVPRTPAAPLRVSVIIPMFNQPELTVNCLASLARHTPEGIAEIIVVDDASSVPFATADPRVTVVRNRENLGFAASCNRGAATAGGDYLLFLNNDTEALPGWLQPLVEVLDRRPEVGIAAPKLIHPGGTLQHCGKVWGDLDSPRSQPTHLYFLQPADLPEANRSREYALVTGACILVRREEFHAFGPFDEAFENGWEDDDLCYAFSSRGKEIWYCAESTLIHYESVTLGADYRPAECAFQRMLAASSGADPTPLAPDAEALLAPYLAMPHQELAALLEGKLLKVRARFNRNRARFFAKWGDRVRRDDHFYHSLDGTRATELPALAPSPPVTSMVILTFNQLEYTRKTVESIRRHTPEPHEIIFVDNASTDGTVEWLQALVARDPRYRLIANDRNLGFSKGCNQGIEASRGDFILLLNNDVMVTPGWLSGLLAPFSGSEGIGIVGPVTNNISGLQRVPGANYQGIDELDAFALEHRRRLPGCRVATRRIVGFCMLFRRSLPESIGLLDEDFGSGNFEDDDFSLRANLAGFRNLIAADVFIHHFGSATFAGNKIDYAGAMAKNREIFNRKWSAPITDRAFALKIQRLRTLEKAELLWERGEPDQAVNVILEEGIRLDPAEPSYYLVLARRFIDHGHHQDALETLNHIPDPFQARDWLILTGLALAGLGRLQEAGVYAARAKALQPGWGEALYLEAILVRASGEPLRAGALLAEALAVDPCLAEAYAELARMAQENGELADACLLAQRSFLCAPVRAENAARYHRLLGELGRLDQGVEEFRAMLRFHPDNRALTLYLVDLLIGLGRDAEALEVIEPFLARFPWDDPFLDACLAIRNRVGPLEIDTRSPQGISLCMIAKNETAHLALCLKSLKPLVQEIVLVDTGSTDRTGDLARVFGARVFDSPWEGDFSLARNVSLQQARGSWVLVMDADEVISELDYQNLRQELLDLAGRAAALSVTTRNYMHRVDVEKWKANDGVYPEERGAGWTPSDKIRLFPNFSGIRFENPIHEMVDQSVIACGLPVVASRVAVHHYGYLDEGKQADKELFYYQLGVKKLAASPNDPIAICELAIQAAAVKRYREAVALWQRALAFDPASSLAYFNLGSCYLYLGDFAASASASSQAMQLKAHYREAITNYALAQLCLGDAAAARSAAEAELGRDSNYPTLGVTLAIACCCLGESPEGTALFQELIGKNVNFDKFLHLVLERLLAAGRVEFAQSVVRAAQLCGYISEESIRICGAPAGSASPP